MASYVTESEFYELGMRDEGVEGLTGLSTVLEACSGRVDDAIQQGGRYSPPLSSPYPPSVKLTVAKLAQYEMIGVGGYYPEEGTEKVIRQRYEDAVKELGRIAAGGAIAGAVDATADDSDADPVFDSDDARGWGFGSTGYSDDCTDDL